MCYRKSGSKMEESKFFGYQVRFPISLQCVDTNLASGPDIGMEYLGQEEPLWRTLRKVLSDGQPHPEFAAVIRGIGGSVDNGLD